MNKAILIFTLTVGFFFTVNAQVTYVRYLIEYNDLSSLYDCKIVIGSGSATTIPQRIQFNAQYSVVVPTGSQLNIQERHNPLEDNQSYNGTIPCMWYIAASEVSPIIQPANDFYSIVPNLETICLYNDLAIGDTITLFSLSVDVDPCENAIRPFENGVDLNNKSSGGILGDYSNGFTLGSISQIYGGNLSTPYGKLQINEPFEMCVGGSSSVYPSVVGIWGSDNPSVAAIDVNTGAINALSGGQAIISYTDGNTGCLSQFELTVFDAPTLSIVGEDELCIGEIIAITSSDEGTWTSNDPTIATIDNEGHVTAVSHGQTEFIFTSYVGCSSASEDITVLSASDPSCIVGIDELEVFDINVYPNPSRDLIFIESESEISSVVIFDMNNQKVKASNFSKGIYKTQILIEDLNQGFYHLSIRSNSKVVYKKIMIL